MTKAKASPKPKGAPAKTHQAGQLNPKLKYIGGSEFDAWNSTIANQALTPFGTATVPMRIEPTNCNRPP